ncbi:MAG: glycosyltransferase family 4 protein [Bryobacteraceae bacterium]
MRILHIDTGAEMRGGQYQVMLLLNGLRERGAESVLLARENAPLWRAAKAAGHLVAPASAIELWKRSRQSDIVHAHDATAHTLAAIASRRHFVVSRRVAFPIKRTALSRWKYSRAEAYLAVSRHVADELVKAHVPRNRIAVVYDGVVPVPATEDWQPTHPIVALESADPGKLGALAADAARLAGVEINFATDVPASLRRASALLYLSRSEGLGSGALLAMNVGVPVIASQVGGLAEIFVHGVSGLYVRNDVEEIATAIRTLLDNRELALRLREGGIARITERFSAEQMVSDTLRVYERAIG